ncbi:hypothetical protein PHMEG_00026559 [Phytophthora megakarya]|uniref:Uncharacterized protein n=1 Tax=Phytophthora megakarya TaxID=4795 RepID=A0A225VA45_9STRA|nr:hypothetical protein PHMEG_00026559 [Phytophthora megakarya]
MQTQFQMQMEEANSRFEYLLASTIYEYVSSFQDLMSQSELEISEMEKRFYFQNGLRAETAKKVKELSSRFLHEVIEITTNFEFIHYGRQSAKVITGPATSKPSTSSKPPLGNQKKSMDRKNTSKGDSRDEWTKTATCHNSGPPGHIKPQCKAIKETNHYVSGSFYAILEVSAWASKQSEPPSAVSIFVDNGSSLNGVTEELAYQLQLDIVQRPKTVKVSHISRRKRRYAGKKWLRANNPDIDWERLFVLPLV